MPAIVKRSAKAAGAKLRILHHWQTGVGRRARRADDPLGQTYPGPKALIPNLLNPKGFAVGRTCPRELNPATARASRDGVGTPPSMPPARGRNAGAVQGALRCEVPGPGPGGSRRRLAPLVLQEVNRVAIDWAVWKTCSFRSTQVRMRPPYRRIFSRSPVILADQVFHREPASGLAVSVDAVNSNS